MQPPPGWRLSGHEQLASGTVVTLDRYHFEVPGGETIDRDVVHHPGAVVVVPLDGDDVILIEQVRVAVGGELLELPAGKRDVAGEAPEDTARRECREEIGFEPTTITPLHVFHNSPGFTDELTHLFLAQDLRPVDRQPEGPEEQAARVVRMPLAEAFEHVQNGHITDAKTIIGIYAAAARR